MIPKIKGFKVYRDRSTCSYKIKNPDNQDGHWDFDSAIFDIHKFEKLVGHYMKLALEKSDFVIVRR